VRSAQIASARRIFETACDLFYRTAFTASVVDEIAAEAGSNK